MHRIAVVTGGSTPERDVAIAGAGQVVKALRDRGFAVSVVDTAAGELAGEAEREFLSVTVGRDPPPPETLERLAEQELGPRLADLPSIRHSDVVFIVLHGHQGEGGSIQAVFDLAGVCYAGSGPIGSGVAMDKDLAKRLIRAAGIPTPDWLMWPARREEVEKLGLPLIVKPSKVGSSVGLSVVRDPAGLEAAVATAAGFDDEILLERYVDGRELTVGILAGKPLGVGEIIPSHETFDYECKYTPGACEEIFPARIDPKLARKVQELALATHVALKLRDFSRIDFRVDADEAPYCLEANTLPGLTVTSLLPQSALCVGLGFAELCESICRSAYDRAKCGEQTEGHKG